MYEYLSHDTVADHNLTKIIKLKQTDLESNKILKAIKQGEILFETKRVLKVEFSNWLKQANINQSSARRLISLYLHFGKSKDLFKNKEVQLCSLYKLSQSSLPYAAREEFLSELQKSQSITNATVNRIIEKHNLLRKKRLEKTKISFTSSVFKNSSVNKNEAYYAALIGGELKNVKAKLSYGCFCSWLKQEYPFSTTTAYKYISIYCKLKPYIELLKNKSISIEGLYKISKKDVPPIVLQKFLNLIKQTDIVLYQDIEEIIEDKNLFQSNQIKLDFANSSTVKLNSWWQISSPNNKNRYLFVGDPNHKNFIKVSKQTNINILYAFPNKCSWQMSKALQNIKFKSVISPKIINQESVISIFSKLIDAVNYLHLPPKIIIAYIPYLELFTYLDNYKCELFIAEPNVSLVKKHFKVLQSYGYTTQSVNKINYF